MPAGRNDPPWTRHSPLFLSSNNSRNNNSFDSKELARRIETLRGAEQQEQSIAAAQNETLFLPVICFDALLPNQRLAFGGQFHRSHLWSLPARRNWSGRTLCHDEFGLPTAQTVTQRRPLSRPSHGCQTTKRTRQYFKQCAHHDNGGRFCILGRRPCRIVGPARDMVARVGRWRRCYDPEGEEAMLGWGDERSVDATTNTTTSTTGSNAAANKQDDPPNISSSSLSHTEWNTNEIDCEVLLKEESSYNGTDSDEQELAAKASSILQLLEEWQALASDDRTYDNVQVVATARRIHGRPGLKLHPARLLQQVRRHLGGEEPPNKDDYNALALYGAALINPLPALGVSPEIRGRILEAPTAKKRLEILEWAIRRSIENLKGTKPL